MFCEKCGNACTENDKFCPSCGSAINAPAENTNEVKKLYFDAKGLTLFNYKFEIKDESGNVRYKAESVTESMVRYNAKLYNANDEDVIKVSQQSKLTFTAMNFDFLAPNGEVITDAIQKSSLFNYTYTLNKFGITLSGNFLKLSFDFLRDGKPIAHIEKKLLSWGDCYELTYTDSSLEAVLLAGVLMIQLVCAARRNKRRR